MSVALFSARRPITRLMPPETTPEPPANRHPHTTPQPKLQCTLLIRLSCSFVFDRSVGVLFCRLF
eukprot:EW705197.1.p4 GENE.EW705197.1~~EW705197.1.p4  ORF type:complete len:65 (+),score=10.67 EW705197.1:272-466(+)